jgi:hypothetical protein
VAGFKARTGILLFCMYLILPSVLLHNITLTLNGTVWYVLLLYVIRVHPSVPLLCIHGSPHARTSNLAPGMSAALIGSRRLFCPIQIISFTTLRLAMRPSAARILCSTGLSHPHWASYLTSACMVRFLAFLHTPLHRPWYLYCGTYADPSIGPSPELL